MGKSSVSLAFALKAAYSGTPVLFVALEMSREELNRKATLTFSKVRCEQIKDGKLSDEEKKRFADACKIVDSLPFHTYCPSSVTTAQLSTIVNIFKKKYKIGLVVVDHLGLVRSSAGDNRDSRWVQVSEVTRTLKTIAKRERIPLIACAQLNRETVKNDDQIPELVNLAENSSVEKDANVLIMVHRPEYYGKREWKGVGQLLVKKNRMGPTGTSHILYSPDLAQIVDCPMEKVPK
jgi:replicative DNA helicase